ncbi:hypothetical protein KKA17_00035 [bacterium]|nr:hypothetical protein [bacterium]MBU1884146.1 hypothetical protein [bacterium]
MFQHYNELDKYLNTLANTTIIKENIPLISNLNILENIAIIKEVHANKPVIEAEQEALEFLKLLSLEEIAKKRVPECNEFEIFCTMLLRAIMSENPTIVIVTPFSLITTLTGVQEIADVISKLNTKKDIIIVDMLNNKTNYEGELCRIVE